MSSRLEGDQTVDGEFERLLSTSDEGQQSSRGRWPYSSGLPTGEDLSLYSEPGYSAPALTPSCNRTNLRLPKNQCRELRWGAAVVRALSAITANASRSASAGNVDPFR